MARAIGAYRYRNFIGPIILIGIGVIALLANFNLIDERALFRLGQLWPVILILVGLAIVANHVLPPVTATTVNLALAGVTLAAVLAYIVVSPGSPPTVASEHSDVSESVQGLQKATLQLGTGATRIDVKSEDLGETLYRARLVYPRGEAPSVNLDRGDGTLNIEGGKSGFHFFWHYNGDRRIQLSLNNRLPWAVTVGGGANSANVDLSSAQVTSLEVSGGATHADVRLPQPKGSMSVDVSGGANNVTVHVPSGSAVRVNASGGANTIDVFGHRVGGFNDASWQTDNYNGSSDRYEVDVSGGASNFRMET
jgi:hypothetical protein